jgi:hypothetical protein
MTLPINTRHFLRSWSKESRGLCSAAQERKKHTIFFTLLPRVYWRILY